MSPPEAQSAAPSKVLSSSVAPISPTVPSTLEPTTSTRIERVEKFFISYVSSSTTEPTEDEYASVVASTEEYFNEFLSAELEGDPNFTLVGLEFILDFTLFGDEAGIPEDRYNIYLDFTAVDIHFTLDSEPPSRRELFGLITDGITSEYLINYVLTLTGTPFAQVTETFMAVSVFP